MRISRARSVRTPGQRIVAIGAMVMACFAGGGCNNGGKQLQADLYQRELRLQEDEIYRLEDCLCEYQEIVRDYRSEVATLKRELTSEPTSKAAAKPGPIKPLEPPASDLEFNAPELPNPEPMLEPTPAAEGLEEAPAFSPTQNDAGPNNPSGSLPAPGDEAPPFVPGGEAAALSPLENEPYPETVVALDQSSVEEPKPIADDAPPAPFAPTPQTLRPLPEPGALEGVRLSATLEQASGDAPATLHVDLQAETHEAPFTGAVSLMLIDPRLSGSERYLVRWDFSAEEIATASDSSGRMMLPVLLPAELRIDQAVQLWARLIDLDGVKSLTMAPLEKALVEKEIEESRVDTVGTAEWRPMETPSRDARSRRYDSSLRMANFVED